MVAGQHDAELMLEGILCDIEQGFLFANWASTCEVQPLV
jgi:hypothetical protein